jgi:hypothetical protein
MTVKRQKSKKHPKKLKTLNALVRVEKAEARVKKLVAEVKHLKEAFGKCVAHLESACNVIDSEGVAEDDIPYEREFIHEMKEVLGLNKNAKRAKLDDKLPSASPADRTEGQDSPSKKPEWPGTVEGGLGPDGSGTGYG